MKAFGDRTPTYLVEEEMDEQFKVLSKDHIRKMFILSISFRQKRTDGIFHNTQNVLFTCMS